eukprot:gene1522-1915_t
MEQKYPKGLYEYSKYIGKDAVKYQRKKTPQYLTKSDPDYHDFSIVKDLVVALDLTDEQINKKFETKQLLQSIKKISTKSLIRELEIKLFGRNPDLYENDEEESENEKKEEDDDYDSLEFFKASTLLSKEELKQILISPKTYKITPDLSFKFDGNSKINHSFLTSEQVYQQFRFSLGSLALSQQTPQHSFRDICQRDRSASIFLFYRKAFRQISHPEMITPSRMASMFNPWHDPSNGYKTFTLAKYNDATHQQSVSSSDVGSIDYTVFSITERVYFSVSGKLFDYSSPYKFEWDNPNFGYLGLMETKETSTQIIQRKFKEMTGQEFNPDDQTHPIFDPKKDTFGYLSDKPVKMFQIPSLKEIGFSSLKQVYLFNKLVIDKILEFPNDLLKEFIESCFEDPKPVGFEILDELRKRFEKMAPMTTGLFEIRNELIPEKRFLKLSISRDIWFMYQYNYRSPQNILYPMYNENFAINVYENYDRFILREYPSDWKKIVFERELPRGYKLGYGGHSVVDKDRFLKNFHYVTKDMFKNVVWDDMLVIGGLMTHCLTGIKKGYGQSDIDVCFYNVYSKDSLVSKIKRFVQSLGWKEGTYSMTNVDNKRGIGCQINLHRHFPYRHIQVNCSWFMSIGDILSGIDIDCTCFGFDGTNVWTLERGIYAMNYRVNFSSFLGYWSRYTSYIPRLLKYVKRGFGITYLSDQCDKILSHVEKNLASYSDYYPKGFELLCVIKYDKLRYQEVIRNQGKQLLFSNGIGKEQFDLEIQKSRDKHFDGYNSTKFPQLIQSLDQVKFNETNSDLLFSVHDWDKFSN